MVQVGLFAMVAMSFAGASALITLPWCVLSMCNTTHVKTMPLNTILAFAPLYPV